LFSVEERVNILKEVTKDIPNVSVESFSGLLIDYAKEKDVHVSVRGLRAITDFEYELQMALLNRNLKSQCETIFMMPTLKNSFVASSLVKEVARLNGDFDQYVPEPVAKAVRAKLNL
jgi:pantetheine-phosphate adenylyltransferase